MGEKVLWGSEGAGFRMPRAEERSFGSSGLFVEMGVIKAYPPARTKIQGWTIEWEDVMKSDLSSLCGVLRSAMTKTRGGQG
jgi:hypothetical protein